MTLTRTGPGRVTTDSRVPRGGVRAVLSNFDIDGDALKTEHINFLTSRVVPILLRPDARIWLQGSASHSGSDAHNMQLSRRRAEAVVTHLQRSGVGATRIQIDAVGESMATPGTSEDQDDRAVALLAAPLFRPPRPVPRPPTPTPPTSTRFRIRMLGGLSAGAVGGQIDNLYFQIVDPVNKLTCFYVYGGGGAGRSVRLPLSATLEGPWNDFNTTGPLQVTEFGGPARFTSGGGAWWTWNYLNMMGLPSGIATIPRSMSIETGFTMGLGAATTAGDLRPVDTEAWPYVPTQ